MMGNRGGWRALVALGVACVLAGGCASTQSCVGSSGIGISSCGVNRWCNPLIDDPVELERLRFAHRSRAKLYLGLTTVAVGLGGIGLGTGFLVRATHREDSARAQLGENPEISAIQREEADDFRTIGIVGLAAGAPLVLLGTALIVADATARPVYPQTQTGQAPGGGRVVFNPLLGARVGPGRLWGASVTTNF